MVMSGGNAFRYSCGKIENGICGFGESKYSQVAKKKILVMAKRTAVVLKFNEDVERATEEMGIFRADGVTVAS
ncbi:hypothetical protein [Peribacillus simplex]|uniref:hypothetical protein n=2 Tax=Peribacillus simplex TaxID=1478 RepID=UPI0036700AD9